MGAPIDIEKEITQLKNQQAALSRAVRIVMSVAAIALTAACIQTALTIPWYTDIFKDFHAPLPGIAQLLIGHPVVFLSLSILLGILALLGSVIITKANGQFLAILALAELLALWQFMASASQAAMAGLVQTVSGNLLTAQPSSSGQIYIDTGYFWLVIFIGIVPAAWVGLRLRRLPHPPPGCCPQCRYDLRAHKPGDRCPECGAPVT